MHPMDPRRGGNLSPQFIAVLAHLLELEEKITDPFITELVTTSDGFVMASTNHDPFLNAFIGSREDVVKNLRGWGLAVDASVEQISDLIDKVPTPILN